MKIKFREGFRPFAPAVLCEEADKFFENNNNNNYMLIVTSIKKDLIENQEKLIKKKDLINLKLEDHHYKQLHM